MHWTEMPIEFQENIEKYKANNAVVFEGTDFFVVWFMLMIKNYDYLANHFVDINPNVNVIFNGIH